jgi:hypothetical protein
VYVTTLESCFRSLCDALNEPSCRSTISADTGPRKLSKSNNNACDNTDQGNPNESLCWVRLYQAVSPDDGIVRALGDGTVRALGDEFPIEPVPTSIAALKLAVKEKSAPVLNHVADYEFKVYQPMGSAEDVLTLLSTAAPLKPRDKVPLCTVSLV